MSLFIESWEYRQISYQGISHGFLTLFNAWLATNPDPYARFAIINNKWILYKR